MIVYTVTILNFRHTVNVLDAALKSMHMSIAILFQSIWTV